MEQISWTELKEVFYDQYFSDTVRSLKKQEFMSLHQEESTSVAEYQARFLRLEQFASSSLASERERAAQFVAGLRIRLRSVVVPFACASLIETVRRALECEHAHTSHRQYRSRGSIRFSTQTRRARDHRRPEQWSRQILDGARLFATGVQQMHRFP